MSHCVASYTEKVLSGRSYIYRILKPERATLELKITDGHLEIGQISLHNNKAPSEETQIIVGRWLYRKSANMQYE